MNPIVMAIDGTYLDLSRIVAIGPVERKPSDYTVRFGFELFFIPEGVPFKQDRSYSITIQKDFQKPKEITVLYPDHTEEFNRKMKDFSKECAISLEEARSDLVSLWKTHKDSL